MVCPARRGDRTRREAGGVSRWEDAKTASERGYAWDRELARRIGGERHAGSGNRVYAKLDASVGGVLLASGKHTDAESLRLTPAMVREGIAAVCGPEASSWGADSILAVHFGLDLHGPALAVLDLDLLVSWLKAPPQIIQASKEESLRATARIPPSLR